MANNSGDLSLQTCANCYAKTRNKGKYLCRHVICDRCDSAHGKAFSGSRCVKCNDAPNSDDESSLAAINPPDQRRLTVLDDSIFERCESCHRTEQMTTRCNDCEMDMCDICVEQHSLMTFLKRHRLSPIVEASQSPNVTCRRHANEAADMTCLSCGQKQLCRKCVQESHKNHELVVENAAGSTKFPPPSMGSTLQPRANTVDGLLRELKNLENEVNARKARIVTEIDHTNKDIQQHALTRVKEMLEEADKMKHDIDEQVREQTRMVQKRQNALLSRLIKRKNFIEQQTEEMKLEIAAYQKEMEGFLQLSKEQQSDSSKGGPPKNEPASTKTARQGNLQMPMDELRKRLQNGGGLTASDSSSTSEQVHFQKSLDELCKLLQELIFQYTPPTKQSEGLGKIEPLRRLHFESSVRLERFQRDDEYVVTGMVAGPGDNIIFTSCKGYRKAAADLVNIQGSTVRTRKLQDRPSDREVTMTPVFGAMIDEEIAIMTWDKSVFKLALGEKGEIESFGVKETIARDARISCIAVSRELARIAFGNDKDRAINVFNFTVDKVSSVNLKESGSPPKSLAFWKKNLLVADGGESAFLANLRGDTIAHFPSIKPDSRPLAVDSCKGIAYVLWGSDQSSSFVQFYSLAQRSLGVTIGRYFTVQDNPCLISVMPTSGREDDRLVTATRDGKMIVYAIQDI